MVPARRSGTFTGEQIHAHHFSSGDQLEGRDVVVVGAGNAAMDIAVEGSFRANRVALSIRRGQWVLRKARRGKPSDQVILPGWSPWWMTGLRVRLRAITASSLSRYGVPRPEPKPGQCHLVQSEQIRVRISTGKIAVHPGFERFDGDSVVFLDGTRVPADLIVWATGYKVIFPFLDPALVSAANSDLSL